MYSKIYSAGITGIDGFIVTVECSARNKLPSFDLVGLPDLAVKEAKERVKNACVNSGIQFPLGALTVNLAPADKKKEGSAFDLPILLSILHAGAIIPPERDLSKKCFVGELSLSGEVRAVNGVLPMTVLAREKGMREIYVPYENRGEASVVEGIKVFGVKSAKELVEHLKGKAELKAENFDTSGIDFSAGKYTFMPHKNGTDGFYIAKLRKNND